MQENSSYLKKIVTVFLYVHEMFPCNYFHRNISPHKYILLQVVLYVWIHFYCNKKIDRNCILDVLRIFLGSHVLLPSYYVSPA